MSTTTGEKQNRGFFGHPRSLANLFGVEMWERFSYYGMQAILLYYLYYSTSDGGLALDPAAAAGIVGAYGGSVYLATIGGSWVADRFIGAERTLFYSAVIIMLGHIALALLPGVAGVAVGLVLVAIGSGGLKANATAIVGTLYSPDEPERRDAGFSIFYIGVNLGALFGPLVTGLLQDKIGFHYGFGAAAIGMALGLIQYSLGRKRLPDSGKHVPNPLVGSDRVKYLSGIVVGLVVVAVLLVTGVVNAENLANIIFWVIIASAVVLFTVLITSKQVNAVERSRLFAFIPLFLTSFVFWSLFQQQFTVLAIYADKRVDLDLWGFQVPPAFFNSVEPLGVIIFAGVFAALWMKLGSRDPGTPMKFALGTAGMGIAFLVMALMGFTEGEKVVNPLLLVGVLIIFVWAEMCLSPVGLSIATKLAPEKFQVQMVALFFLSVAAGNSTAGRLADLYTEISEPAYFGILGGGAIVVAVLMAVMIPWTSRRMQGVK